MGDIQRNGDGKVNAPRSLNRLTKAFEPSIPSEAVFDDPDNVDGFPVNFRWNELDAY